MIRPEHIIEFAQTPPASFCYAAYCGDKDLDATLIEAFSTCGPEVLMLVAMDETNLILQVRDGVRRLPRNSIRELSVYPVLPAKACGHVQMNLELDAKDPRNYLEFFMCGPHSEAVEHWCMDKATQIANMLGVAVQLLEPGHDC
ncbi:hypothetical protein [Prosthecobacter sp.]|uniref:hypothetical protein n=1 Tax=Prosthecobacter sp. TaxID=1965333 RepID=UPI002ABA75AB|nr:hypothetical protein [Prosthecobacter sp.]MDZ4403352.1 hypothetical protein [Prosthecobacter sp.]